MDLFNSEPGGNLLPFDGTANYYGQVLTATESNRYFDQLLHSIQWQHDEVVIFGKRHITKRKVAWYGDAAYAYTYSNTTKQALLFTEELLQLKQLAEEKSGALFNSCLLNFYHHGEEGMSWHSDDEACFGNNPTIASISLGAERRFLFRHKQTKQTVEVWLQNGSLLIMKDATQTNWLHSLPKTTKVAKSRINLTFRKMLV